VASPRVLTPTASATAPPWRTAATVGALAAAGTAVLAVGDPNTTRVPLCPLKAVTGLDCPFCGSLRAVHSLTHLDLAGAANHNLVFTVAAPFLVAAWAWWLAGSLGWVRPVPTDRLPAAARVVAVVALLAFALVRNLPAFSWLDSTA
jgi:hypothetical protein